MLLFSVIRGTAPTSDDPEDILIWATIAPTTTFPSGIVVQSDQNIELDDTLVSVSVLGNLRVTTGDDVDILLDNTYVNASVLATWETRISEDGEDERISEDGEDVRISEVVSGIVVQLSPPDAFIYPPVIVNESLVNEILDLEVAEAPADGYIYPTQIVNASDVNPTDDLEVQEVSPYDVDLVAPQIVNVSVVNGTADLIVELGDVDDDDPIAGAHVAGGTVA